MDLDTRLTADDFPDIPADTFDRLARPRRVIETQLFVPRTEGGVSRYQSWRVQHDDFRGPCKGGVRFHPGVSRTEVERLARGMTMKCALYGLPFGGGKGGVAVDVHGLDGEEREALTRAYTRSIAPFVGPSKDVPAPDVNTGEREMGWMRDELAKWRGSDHAAVVTGKSVERGGIPGRDEATGSGAFFVIDAALDERPSDTTDLTVAVQGLGAAAKPLLKRMHEAGYTVRAVSDSSGGVYAADGLDIPALLEAKTVSGELANADIDSLGEGAVESISSDDLIVCDVDILIPAALGDVVTNENAADVRASHIFEVANLAVSPNADEILRSREIRVFPDILVNGGGVVVSWMEWRNNLANNTSTREEVLAALDERMRATVARVMEWVGTADSIRHAALYLALEALTETKHEDHQ